MKRESDRQNGFTLIELLVVIAVIAVLLAVLMPALARAKSQAMSVVCKSNIRQLALSNITYVANNKGAFVLAAQDIMSKNLHRWHGVRDNQNNPFDPARGPLASYLADGAVRHCPQRVDFRKQDPWDYNFEQGSGGYGYNMTYIGSRVWERYSDQKCSEPTRTTEVRSPAATLMFADAAMAKRDSGQLYYLEYSFAEPFYFVVNGQPSSAWGNPSPSIHFRHYGKAAIAWCDGHVEDRAMAAHDGVNAYGVRSAQMQIGWFAPLDNSLFDLQ